MCRVSRSRALRSLFILGVLTGGLAGAWRAWRLPHASDDWIHRGN